MAAKENADQPHFSLDDILKSCASFDEHAKLKFLIEKYDELHKMYRNQEFCYNTTKRELSSINAERNKQVLARSRLEGLCRELQKQNKTMKEENMLKLRDEEEKRKQLTQEFQKTLGGVTTMMTESNSQNTKLGEENKQMAQRLSSIYEEFKARENEVDRISRQIDMERELAEARSAKMRTEYLIEKQGVMTENNRLNEKIVHLNKELLESTTRCVELENQVLDLTAQINNYTGKYEEFESTITRSGKVFDHCKSEITKMSKQIKTLEKEVIDWQHKYHKNVGTLYELQIENAEKIKLIDRITKKQNQLAKLCRQLQAERKAYINALRELGKNPADIAIDSVDDSTTDEPSTSKPSLPSEDCKLGAKPKSLQIKQKPRKRRGRKINDVSPEETPTLTPKEIQLAELKQELYRVQNQMLQIQSGNRSENEVQVREIQIKQKPRKRRGRKIKDISPEATSLTQKEIQLAELKQELYRVQNKMLYIQSGDRSENEVPDQVREICASELSVESITEQDFYEENKDDSIINGTNIQEDTDDSKVSSETPPRSNDNPPDEVSIKENGTTSEEAKED